MTWLIGRTYSSHDYNGDVDYMLVNMTKDHATELLILMAKVRLLKKDVDNRVAYLTLWFPGFTALDACKLENRELVFDEEGAACNFVPVTAAVAKAAKDDCTSRTECDMVAVWDDHVLWKCYPKHTEGIHIESKPLHREELEKYCGT